MARKIFSGILIAFSFIFLIASAVGIGAAWYYNEPLTEDGVSRLREIETELTRTQSALQDAQEELERTLRIVDSAEETLARVTGELAQAKLLFDEFDRTMGDRLIPGLENSKERLNSVRGTLEDLRAGLEQLNNLPIINLNLPGDELLLNLIETVDSIDTQIDRLNEMADKASTFAEDVSLLMGGDLGETRQRLETFLVVVGDYEQKVADWHEQVLTYMVLLPVWIDRASFLLTIFLLWFGFSQFVLLLYGLALWRGGDPLLALRREPVPVMDSLPAQAAVLAQLDEVVDELEEVADELEETAEELDEGDEGKE